MSTRPFRPGTRRRELLKLSPALLLGAFAIHLKPLNEHVQVFQRPFRIVQGVLIDASPSGQAALKEKTSVTIKGVLHYQACDDKVCFTPQSVQLTWTVALRPLDRERAKP